MWEFLDGLAASWSKDLEGSSQGSIPSASTAFSSKPVGCFALCKAASSQRCSDGHSPYGTSHGVMQKCQVWPWNDGGWVPAVPCLTPSLHSWWSSGPLLPAAARCSPTKNSSALFLVHWWRMRISTAGRAGPRVFWGGIRKVTCFVGAHSSTFKRCGVPLGTLCPAAY